MSRGVIALGGLLRALPALACLGAIGWYAADQLRPLAGLVPMTRQTAAVTRDILTETRALQAGVTEVHAAMASLREQEQLLAEQEALTRAALAELHRQEELNREAQDLLARILAAERQTAELTRSAQQAGSATMAVVAENARELQGLRAQTQRITAASRTVDGQLDAMLAEMSAAVDNFARVGRLKEAAGQVAERATQWWQRVWEWLKRW